MTAPYTAPNRRGALNPGAALSQIAGSTPGMAPPPAGGQAPKRPRPPGPTLNPSGVWAMNGSTGAPAPATGGAVAPGATGARPLSQFAQGGAQAGAQPAAAPGAPGPVAVSAFSPTSNMIGSQILPQNSRRTAEAEQWATGAGEEYVGASAAPVGNFGEIEANDYGESLAMLRGSAGGGGGGFGFSGDTTKVRGLTMGQLERMMAGGGPDRAKLAAEQFSILEDASQPGYEQTMRRHAQKVGALGRVGSGMTTSELGDVTASRERALALEKRRLAAESAGLSLQDQRDLLDASRSVGDSFAGQDVQAGGLNLSAANAASSSAYNAAMGIADLQGRGRKERVGERDFALDLDTTTYDRKRNRFSDLSTYEREREARDKSDRGEMRGERDYQYGADRDAIGDARDERILEEDITDRRHRRGMDLVQTGYGGNPTGAYQGAGTYYGGQAGDYGAQAGDAYGAAGEAASNWAYNRNRVPGAPGAPGGVRRRPVPSYDTGDTGDTGANAFSYGSHE